MDLVLEAGEAYCPLLPMEGERWGASRGSFSSHWLGGQECPPSLLSFMGLVASI